MCARFLDWVDEVLDGVDFDRLVRRVRSPSVLRAAALMCSLVVTVVVLRGLYLSSSALSAAEAQPGYALPCGYALIGWLGKADRLVDVCG